MSKIIIKKNGTDYPLLTMPNHYPADRVYLDGDTTKSVQDKVARKADLTNLDLTGTANTTGSTISSGTYFYLNGTLVRAKTTIASGATFTLNTNYEVVTVGDRVTSVEQKISEKESITKKYYLTFINGWTGTIYVNVNSDNNIVGIGGVLNGTNATSDSFANASTNLSDCITNKKLPVGAQAASILANQAFVTQKIGFLYSNNVWTATADRTAGGNIAVGNIYFRS